MTKEMASNIRLEKRSSSSMHIRSKSNEADLMPISDPRVKRLSNFSMNGTHPSISNGHLSQMALQRLSHQIGNQAVQREVLQRGDDKDEGWLNKILKEGGEFVMNPLAYPGKKAKGAKNWIKAKAKEKYKSGKKWLKDLF